MLTLALLTLAACGRPVTPSDVKLAGVGNDPAEIGPAPEFSGGLIEYDYFEYRGAGLSLASLGLLSYGEVGPNFFTGFEPPYAMIYGLGFVFDEAVPAPDVHHGNVPIPPDVEDTCWTNLQPRSALMASTVELGSQIALTNADDSVYFGVGRFPEIYPPDPRDVFVYYFEIQSAQNLPLEHYAPSDDGGYELATLRPANWAFGEEMTLTYPGGLPPVEAPISGIPQPSTVVPDQKITLPSEHTGVSMSWSGPTWDAFGEQTASEGEWNTCLSFIGNATESEQDCSVPAAVPDAAFNGQLYTGPWDTEDGVTFQWEPGDNDGETLSLSVVFLAPIDADNDSFKVGVVNYELDDGTEGSRDVFACDLRRDIDYAFDESLIDDFTGELPTSLAGDPTSNVAEVSCLLADDGSFTLTNAHLARAREYAVEIGSPGAVFYLVRSTEIQAQMPDLRDGEGFRRQVGTVTVRSNNVALGRFWVDDPSDLGGSFQ